MAVEKLNVGKQFKMGVLQEETTPREYPEALDPNNDVSNLILVD